MRRKWCVDADDVRVELGFVAFNDTSKEALALRIAVLHSSRSSELAAGDFVKVEQYNGGYVALPAYTANDISGLRTSNLVSSPPGSAGGLTTTSRSTSSARPLNHHFSSPAPPLACRLFFDGVTALPLERLLVLGRICEAWNTDDVRIRSRMIESSASLRLRERRTPDCPAGRLLPITPPPLIHSQRSVSSPSPLSKLASQMRQSEKSKKSRSRGREERSS